MEKKNMNKRCLVLFVILMSCISIVMGQTTYTTDWAREDALVCRSSQITLKETSSDGVNFAKINYYYGTKTAKFAVEFEICVIYDSKIASIARAAGTSGVDKTASFKFANGKSYQLNTRIHDLTLESLKSNPNFAWLSLRIMFDNKSDLFSVTNQYDLMQITIDGKTIDLNELGFRTSGHLNTMQSNLLNKGLGQETVSVGSLDKNAIDLFLCPMGYLPESTYNQNYDDVLNLLQKTCPSTWKLTPDQGKNIYVYNHNGLNISWRGFQAGTAWVDFNNSKIQLHGYSFYMRSSTTAAAVQAAELFVEELHKYGAEITPGDLNSQPGILVFKKAKIGNLEAYIRLFSLGNELSIYVYHR